MRTKDLDDGLRKAINEYLSKHYGTQLPASKTYVIDERNDYLYMDTENDNVFYIPKSRLAKPADNAENKQ